METTADNAPLQAQSIRIVPNDADKGNIAFERYLTSRFELMGLTVVDDDDQAAHWEIVYLVMKNDYGRVVSQCCGGRAAAACRP